MTEAVQDVAQKASRFQLNPMVFCTLLLVLPVPAVTTLVMSVREVDWSAPFSRFDYSDYSPPAPLEPNDCLIACAPACGNPPPRTMATGCVTAQVGCKCSSGQSGTCTGCKTVCSSRPGWTPYSTSMLAVAGCSEAIETCKSTCTCNGHLHELADTAFTVHIWVTAWVLAPLALGILCMISWGLKKITFSLPCCKSIHASPDNTKDVGTMGRMIGKMIPASALAWLLLSVIANGVDVALGWLFLTRIEATSNTRSIGEICGHEYLSTMGLKQANIAATFRGGALVLAILCPFLSSPGAAQPRATQEEHEEVP